MDLDKAIQLWVKQLQTQQRSSAIAGLSQFVSELLAAHAQRLCGTLATMSPVSGSQTQDTVALEQRLFTEGAEPSSAQEFYASVAGLLRGWLLTRLEWWCVFHRVATALPEDLRSVHDLLFYANLPVPQVAAILGKSVETVEVEKTDALRLLRPLFDKARGKE